MKPATLYDAAGNAVGTLTNPLVADDAQLAGVYDDGTPDGLIRSKLAQGELIRRPFRPNMFQAYPFPGSTAALSYNLAYNPDGTTSSITVIVPADATRAGQGAEVRFAFYGRAFGLRFRQDNSSGLADCSATIDGVIYKIPGQVPLWTTDNLTVTEESLALVAEDLTDGRHLVRLSFVASPTVQRIWILYGFLVERRAGYKEATPILTYTAPAAVPTTPIGPYVMVSGVAFTGIRQLVYTNTAASATTIKLFSNADGAAGHQVWEATLAATGTPGASATFDTGERMSVYSLYHSASQVGANFTVYGGWS